MTQIYEYQNYILIYTESLEPAEHCHMAAHVIVSMKDKMKAVVDGNEYRCQGIMIPSGVLHKIETYSNPVLVFLYDSATNVARHIQNAQDIDAEKCVNIISQYEEFEAAIAAGFYSSAHFADVNRRVFGISIRNISKDLNYIKVK